MDLSVEESGLVFCGLFCRVAASPYPTYKTVGPVSAAPPGKRPHNIIAR
ncbi:hypothetical protein CSC04_1518 [Enterobacter roggenkampii]|nr:hypothetical protein CSC04_1518 [Enterobacter roggenkampii]